MPTAPGTELEYRWTSPTATATVRLSLLRARETTGGTSFTWAVRTTNGESARTSTIERECNEDGAEEPWVMFGTADGSEITRQGWRVPRRLSLGTTYSGTLEARVAGFGLSLARSHRVGARERVEVAGARRLARRIAIEDAVEGGAAPLESVAWVTEGIGLLKLELRASPEHVSIYELVSVER